jgi:4-hydroxybenzoate polyprenyltransferase
MKNWIIYTKERFPIPVYLLLCGGLAFSGISLFEKPFCWLSFFISITGLLLFFFELRLMDELKDFKKDLIAHPDRPLPRELISRESALRAIMNILFAMIAYAVLTGVLLNLQSAVSYMAITTYLWLMYKEFFVGKWLDERPLLYAISHQVIVIAVCIFSITAIDPDKYLYPESLYLCLMILGSFFSYEICRKLDPTADKVLKTYLDVYGLKTTCLVVIASTCLAAIGANGLNLNLLLWPLEGLLVFSLVVILLKPNVYKIVEGMATISLFFHLWAIFIRRFMDFTV